MSKVAVAVDGIGMRFGRVEALQSVTFTVPEGAFVAIIGPNGAGKSTLLHIVLGLLAPSQGSVTLFGHTPAEFPATDLGYIPQLKTLDRSFPAKAIELVVTGLRRSWPWRINKEDREKALLAMEQTGVAQIAERPISALSGGELQRVYLARSLVRKPRLVILDEPAAGMDAMGEADMYHLLGKYQKENESTILMITHDWEGARYHASHVLLLDREMLDFGPPETLARNERLLRMFGFTGHVETTHTGTEELQTSDKTLVNGDRDVL